MKLTKTGAYRWLSPPVEKNRGELRAAVRLINQVEWTQAWRELSDDMKRFVCDSLRPREDGAE